MTASATLQGMLAMRLDGKPQRRRTLLSHYIQSCGRRRTEPQSVTALRAAKIEVELAYRARGRFMASMSHELRTPLNAIIGFTTMLRDAEKYDMTPAQIREYLEHILTSADTLLSHIDTVMQLAEAQSGGAKFCRQKTDITEIFKECASDILPQSKEKGIDIDVRLYDNLPDVFVDPDRVFQALSHLLSMAVEVCVPGNTISLIAKPGYEARHKKWLYGAVTLNGTCLQQEEIDQAMQICEQVNNGLDRKFAGKVLGLPIAKSFVELNGGKFNIVRAKGSGMSIQFAFSAHSCDKTVVPTESAVQNTLRQQFANHTVKTA